MEWVRLRWISKKKHKSNDKRPYSRKRKKECGFYHVKKEKDRSSQSDPGGGAEIRDREELGLLDRVMKDGWKSLSAKETGRVGGLMTRRKKEMKKQAAEKAE